MEIQKYNRKGFLLPDSIHSMAAYHAKLFDDGKYIFRVHDCITGIRLTGQLETENDYDDAIMKLRELATAALMFSDHIQKQKFINQNKI